MRLSEPLKVCFFSTTEGFVQLEYLTSAVALRMLLVFCCRALLIFSMLDSVGKQSEGGFAEWTRGERMEN